MVDLSDMTGRVGQAKDKDAEDLLLKMRAEMDEISLRGGRGWSGKAKPSTTTTATATNAVFSSAAANNYYQAIGYRMGIGSAISNNNKGKNISWKGLKEDASLDMSATKSEEISYKYSLGDKSITTLQEILAYAMEKGRTPAEVADYLSNVAEATKEVSNTHTEKLLAEALDNNKMYAEIVNFLLLKTDEAKRKDEEGKTGMKPGGKTPAEIAVNLQQIEEEMKTRELVQQALEVCKTAGKENQIEDEQGVAKELVNKQGMIRSGVAAYLLMKAGHEKESRNSAKLNSSDPLPIKSFHCNPATDELSTTSSVTNHLKSVPSIASVASSGCSIVTEIGHSNVDCSPCAVSQTQNKEKKLSLGLLGMNVPFSKRSKKALQREDGNQDTSRATCKFETPEKVVVDKKDERKTLLGAKLISEDLNGEVQEIALTMADTAYGIESHSASDNSSSLWDNIEEKDEDCIDTVKKGKVDEESDSRPDVGQKVNEVSKDLKAATLKGKPRRILTFKKKPYKENEEKRSLRKIDHHKPKICGDSSDGTEETDIKSCCSNESASVKTEYDNSKADQTSSELVMDGPIASISIDGSDPTVDDEVTLPSVLRRKSKINILNEPAVLKKWWSDVSTDETETQYSRDSVASTRQSEYSEYYSRAKQGCLCELKHEMELFACEIREFCSSVGQRACTMSDCNSTDSQEQQHNLTQTQMEAKSGDDEVAEIEIVRTSTNELKRTIRELGSF